jgi:hypothetical protein
MTDEDLRTKLDQASPLPWRLGAYGTAVLASDDGYVAQPGAVRHEDIPLIIAAANVLPDHLDRIDALEAALADEKRCGFAMSADLERTRMDLADMTRQRDEARALLVRAITGLGSAIHCDTRASWDMGGMDAKRRREWGESTGNTVRDSRAFLAATEPKEKP